MRALISDPDSRKKKADVHCWIHLRWSQTIAMDETLEEFETS